MKWTTATVLFLALAAGGVGAAVVLNRQPKTPDQILEDIKAKMGSPLFDKANALSRLDRALDDTRGRGDDEVTAGLLRTRADIYSELGAYDRARADLEMLLANHQRGDRSLELELAVLQDKDEQTVEALQRVRALIQREPEFTEAWATRGRLEESAAAAELDAAYAKLNMALARTEASHARDLVDELAARDAEDPQRAGIVFELRDIFYTTKQDDLNEVLGLVASPRAGLRRARAAYARAIAGKATGPLVVALTGLLDRAGQQELALSLGVAGQASPEIAQNVEAMTSLLDALIDAKRIPEARSLLLSWDWKLGGSLEFYRSAGQVFYEAEEYPAMAEIAGGLRGLGADAGTSWSKFYGSIPAVAQARRIKDPSVLANPLSTSAKRLREFIREEEHNEPFYGARIDAWFWLADCYRYLGDTGREREALRAGLGLRPEHSAEAWIRLAETLRTRKSVPWAEVEEALTHALNLAPEQTSVLAPGWLEAGSNALEQSGATVRALVDRLAREGRAVPAIRRVGPAVLTRIAASHLQNERGTYAIRAAKQALQDFPDLVPPLDIIIAAELLEPGRYELGEDLVRRLELGGLDASVEGFLERMPPDSIEGDLLVRAIRAAPSRFGKPAVAQWYRERGDIASATEALDGLTQGGSGTSLRLLRARTLLDSEDWAAAERELRKVPKDDRQRAEALLLSARAAIGGDQIKLLPRYVNELPSAPGGLRRALEMADLVTAAGRAGLARPLVDAVDEVPAMRTPDFYRRRVLVDVLAGEPSEAAESILRAEAYLEDGTPALAAIVSAVDGRRWTELPDLVERLRESEFTPNPKQSAILSLIGERIETGARAARAGLEMSPRDADWALISAAADAMTGRTIELPPWFGPTANTDAARLLRGNAKRKAQDPRDTLVLVLLSEVKGWTAWARPRLALLRRSTGSSLWTDWLLAQLDAGTGDLRAVRKTAERLVERHRQFGPGHDLAVRTVKATFPTEPLHPQVVRARRLRLDGMGTDLITNPVEIGLAKAGELSRKGDTAGAVAALQEVIQAGGNAEIEARLILGILMLRAQQPSLAAQHLFVAATGDPGVFRDIVVDSLLFSIRYAIKNAEDGEPQRGELGRAKALQYFNALVLKYELDPVVALARLEFLELAEGERGARARGILEQLFERSGQKTLEALRPGSARTWVETLIPIAVDVADDLVQRDLSLEPGNLEMWRLAAAVAEARGDLKRATDIYETLLAIDSKAATGYAMASLLIQEGATRREVEPILRQADRAQGGGSVRSNYLRAVAQMRSANAPLDSMVTSLATIWETRDRARDDVDPLELGLLYMEALFRRNTAEDQETILALLAELEESMGDELYVGDVLSALEGVAKTAAGTL